MWIVLVSFIFLLLAPFSFCLAIAALFLGRPELSIALGVISIAAVNLDKFLKGEKLDD